MCPFVPLSLSPSYLFSLANTAQCQVGAEAAESGPSSSTELAHESQELAGLLTPTGQQATEQAQACRPEKEQATEQAQAQQSAELPSPAGQQATQQVQACRPEKEQDKQATEQAKAQQVVTEEMQASTPTKQASSAVVVVEDEEEEDEKVSMQKRFLCHKAASCALEDCSWGSWWWVPWSWLNDCMFNRPLHLGMASSNHYHGMGFMLLCWPHACLGQGPS